MSTLSLCMIVRNEEELLGQCLEGARPYVDQIVVVDTGSTDGTLEIAARYAEILDHFPWVDDFSAARNASLEHADGDWTLVLDADEFVDPETFGRMRELMADPTVDGYLLQHYNYTNEPWNGRSEVPAANRYAAGYKYFETDPILRLFRNHPGIRFAGSIHETVDDSIDPQSVRVIDLPIHHYLHASSARPRAERVLTYLEMMERELAKKPDGRLYRIAGASALHFAKDYQKAYGYLIKAAEQGYRVNESLLTAAEACYFGGKYELALRVYEQVYATGHRPPTLCLNMASLAVRIGNAPRAIQLFEQCLEQGGLGPEKDAIVKRNMAALVAAQQTSTS